MTVQGRLRWSLRAMAVGVVWCAVAGPAVWAQMPGPATEPAAAPKDEAQTTRAPGKPERFSVHAQGTVISQDHDAFHSPYEGLNSLPRHEGWKTSITGTLFFGARLPWAGGEVYFDPEIAGGEGFGGVKGIAGFPNGEIPRVGTPEPEPYVARLFYRQEFDLGGEKGWVEAQQNQLAGYHSDRRV